MPELLIESFMTASPHTIGKEQTLSTAHRLMREARIRHLPVLEGGVLVGVVSAGDLDFVETLRDVDPEQLSVAQAMTQDVFAVGPKEPLRNVAQQMADNKYGSVVVQDHGKVVGVFTTVDAMRALLKLLPA
jgi:acetoin utilization protein AcuB